MFVAHPGQDREDYFQYHTVGCGGFWGFFCPVVVQMLLPDVSAESCSPVNGNDVMMTNCPVGWFIDHLQLTPLPLVLFLLLLLSLANIPLTPETARDQERRIRREIANSNERRRMQSINAGFQSLKTLIPHSDGEKLSKVGGRETERGCRCPD